MKKSFREAMATGSSSSGTISSVDARKSPAYAGLLIHFEDREERLLRDLDVADLLHALFALFLLL
jgi:hypothetical protein